MGATENERKYYRIRACYLYIICYIYKSNLVILYRVPAGTGIMIPAPASFNKWVFKSPIPITHVEKSSPHTHPVTGITRGYPRERVKLTSLLLTTHVSVTTRYGPKRLMVATRAEFVVWGPPMASYISVSRVGPTEIDVENIWDLVHTLKKSVQRQLEEANSRYMDLNKRHEKEKKEWRQQMQSME